MSNSNFANSPVIVIVGLLITLFVGMPSVLEYNKPKSIKIKEPIEIDPPIVPTVLFTVQPIPIPTNTPSNGLEKQPTPSRTSDPTPTPTLMPSKILPKSNEVKAVINDSDGYTNVRSGQGTKYEIIDRVSEGEVFYTIPQQSDWWPVRTKDNKLGYMHRSRIRIEN